VSHIPYLSPGPSSSRLVVVYCELRPNIERESERNRERERERDVEKRNLARIGKRRHRKPETRNVWTDIGHSTASFKIYVYK
jgi:hypothetical protein